MVCDALRGLSVNTEVTLADLPFHQQFNHFGCNFFCALIELLRREIRDGVRHFQKAETFQTPGARHRVAGGTKHVRDDRSRGNTLLFKYDAVEHTARAA